MEQQRVMTMRRILYLLESGVFDGWITGKGPEAELRKLALFEAVGIFDYSLSVTLGLNYSLWLDNVRIPRENLLNFVADVSPEGQYLSEIKDPGQRFATFLAPLTNGRVSIAGSAIYKSKINLAICIRYSLTRRAFSITPNGPEVVLLDYPSHQRRFLPLLGRIYAMSFAGNYLKTIYVKRTPESNITIYIISSAFKATLTWHNMRTLQECREACGGQGLKTENHVGHLKCEYDVQCTFEGDNKVLMQQLADELGKAFSERAIFQTFIEAEAAPSSGSLKKILGLLRSMYALISLEEDATFVRYGYLSPDNAAAVRKEMTKLCSELRPHALALVSSFGIPDAFLSPLVFNWVEANSWSSV